MQYLHRGLCKDYLDNGYDPDATDIGVALLNKAGRLNRQRLHNQKLMESAPMLYPPLSDRADKSTLALTHHTLSLRIYRAGMTSPITGLQYSLENPRADADLKQKVRSGCTYMLLDADKLTPNDCMLISAYKNKDQDKNLASDIVSPLLSKRH